MNVLSMVHTGGDEPCGLANAITRTAQALGVMKEHINLKVSVGM